MSDFVFNIAKGRVVEYYNRVENNDPANSALVIVVVDRAGQTDAIMKDYDNLSTLLGDALVAEVTNGGGTPYARKILTDADLAALPAPDDTNDRYDVDIPDQTWNTIAAGSSWTDMIVCYDSDTTGGADTAIIPLTCHTFQVVPAGSTITAQIAAAGFFRAS